MFVLRWPWPAAPAVLGAWQSWGAAAPDEVFSGCKLQTASEKAAGAQPKVTVSGLYLGSPERLEALLGRWSPRSAPARRTAPWSGRPPICTP